MRKPASFSQFLLAAGYVVWTVQVAAGGLIVLHSLGAMLLGDRTASPLPDSALAEWILPVDAVLSVLVVAIVWVQYRRGELDTYDGRRRARR